MKKTLAGIIFIISLSTAASAQEKRLNLSEEQKKELKEKNEAYKNELNLSSDQQQRFEEANLQFARALAKLKEDGSKLGKYRKFKAATEERNKKMKELLSPEQYKIFLDHQKELKEELRSRRAKQ